MTTVNHILSFFQDMIAKKCPIKDPIVSRTKEELLTKVDTCIFNHFDFYSD